MKWKLLTDAATQSSFDDVTIRHTLGGRILAWMSIFVYDSLESIITWLMVMFSVILCDFITGSRKALIMHEPFRVSKAIRATMGKICTYFSFVVAAVFIENASGIQGSSKWAIVIVCAGEGISIVNNILKPKGYSIDINKLFAFICGKIPQIGKEAGEVLTKDKEGKI